jgi:4-carboxymuconolactone decarboxylase
MESKILILGTVVLLLFNTTINAQYNMKNKQNLDDKHQCMVAISALTAKGDIPQLKTYLAKGLDDGLTISEIKEELVQLYAYCGFPRSLNAINAFMAVLEKRKAKGITDPAGRDASPVNEGNKYQAGKANLQKLTGREEKSLSGANVFAPLIDTFLKEHLFADIFNRDILTFQQRELVTISALATLSGVEAQLQAHIRMGMNTGLTEGQLKGAFEIIGLIIGVNAQDTALDVLAKAIDANKRENAH